MESKSPRHHYTRSISSISEPGLGIDNLDHGPSGEITDASSQRRLLSPTSTYVPSPHTPYQGEQAKDGVHRSSWQSGVSTPETSMCLHRTRHIPH